ncbi:MAG TPA: pyruvate dehydrogenase complex dihydrolipoamide acetyltransferase [Opitutaceae bacterium]|jgi:pyruvate dehydrogenase E2 component (dihydrolipoamide acetyltransferase)|nr:pyruvate dehydrogenase complex dihydrolipoamide acetyltransferase [Opitutaceae bacterium]
MADVIEMPKLSDTMTTGTLVKWLKKEGDKVASGDMLAEVETDKATMELESFFDGVLLKIFIPAGSSVPIGAALCAVGKPGENVEAPAPKAGGAADSGSAKSAPAPSAGEGSDARPGKGEEAPRQGRPEASAGRPASSSPAKSEPAPSSDAPSEPESSSAAGSGAERIRISPLARKLAEQKKIDPALLQGSGPGGRIVRADVLAAEKAGLAGKTAGAVRSGGAPSPFKGQAPARSGQIQEEKLVALSNMRATIARRLVESKSQIPHFYLDIEIDAAPLLELRAQLNAGLEAEGVKLSVNDFILKASVDALRRVPAVNCSWADPGTGHAAVRQHAAAHISFAVAIDDGLITPVIKDAHTKSLFAISAEAKTLAKRAKERKLQPPEFTGGTFCVSNLGMMGIDRFSAIINPPNAAILAVGTTVRKPVVRDDQIVIGQRMTLTLSVDHRVVDGAVGATFLAALKELLEKPALLLV